MLKNDGQMHFPCDSVTPFHILTGSPSGSLWHLQALCTSEPSQVPQPTPYLGKEEVSLLPAYSQSLSVPFLPSRNRPFLLLKSQMSLEGFRSNPTTMFKSKKILLKHHHHRILFNPNTLDRNDADAIEDIPDGESV